MMSLTFGLFTQVSGSGPLGPLVWFLGGFWGGVVGGGKVNQLGYVAPPPPYTVLLMCKIPIYGIRAITKSVDS